MEDRATVMAREAAPTHITYNPVYMVTYAGADPSRGYVYVREDTRPAPAATDTGLVSNCDGKEQEAFETWAKTKRYDMHEHPMHYLFLDPKTNAAREGWNEAIRYCRSQAVELLAAERAEKERLRCLLTSATYDLARANDECGALTIDNAAKDARIKRLELDNAKLEERLSTEQESHSRTGASRDKWREKVEALEAKLAAAEKALEPFAEHANDRAVDDTGWRDKETVKIVVSIGDLRKARAVLGGKPS